ncbi:PQ-loop domain-containing transporter [Shinella sp.]|uniref:PQ-loop domain-containing transporter n=1 Tax=Shinella sp. TaxID=1870904 RepID=UPI00403627DD
MDMALLVGYLASAASTTSFVPQVWKLSRTGDTAAISAKMHTLTRRRIRPLDGVRYSTRRVADRPDERFLLLAFRTDPH